MCQGCQGYCCSTLQSRLIMWFYNPNNRESYYALGQGLKQISIGFVGFQAVTAFSLSLSLFLVLSVRFICIYVTRSGWNWRQHIYVCLCLCLMVAICIWVWFIILLSLITLIFMNINIHSYDNPNNPRNLQGYCSLGSPLTTRSLIALYMSLGSVRLYQ